jgi:hypothetical protein
MTRQSALAPAPSSASSDWTASLAQASQEVQSNRYAVADRLLADFVARYPNSPEALESSYWRALFKLDPANPATAPHEAGVLLDGYLATPAAGAHRTEAAVLRRVASSLEPRPALTAAAPAAPPGAARADDKARDDELQRLKDELAKANAELERIKRRLAQPKP